MNDVNGNGMNKKLEKCIDEAARSTCTRTNMNTGKNQRKNEKWCGNDVRVARNEQKRCNQICRQLQKKRHESEQSKLEYQEA
jgi:hypothetical protein